MLLKIEPSEMTPFFFNNFSISAAISLLHPLTTSLICTYYLCLKSPDCFEISIWLTYPDLCLIRSLIKRINSSTITSESFSESGMNVQSTLRFKTFCSNIAKIYNNSIRDLCNNMSGACLYCGRQELFCPRLCRCGANWWTLIEKH